MRIVKSSNSKSKFPEDFFILQKISKIEKGSYGQIMNMGSIENSSKQKKVVPNNKRVPFNKYSYYSFLKNTPLQRSKQVVSQNSKFHNKNNSTLGKYRVKDLNRSSNTMKSSKSSRENYNSSPNKCKFSILIYLTDNNG